MQVRFRDKKLERCFLEHKKATREFGEQVARRFIQRVDILQNAPDYDTLMKLPGLRCHPLKGKRAGQWAITLVDRWRLIFTFKDDTRTIVQIEEVSNHYDD
ncbi:type II toxin-antitoxin system RelE/ParE family toxin [uncultured Meiothermus sp.]|uniref:type II toxin-antitoxin system RelE/ParE family toxin n=1 Tax=uncultured Meiothermus sp. TaxID=157471 RepID=UPI0026394C9B|nr:type II toxin-antitoxin system RelE/ParE family toxin [uncultured Meiothermus sp.]